MLPISMMASHSGLAKRIKPDAKAKSKKNFVGSLEKSNNVFKCSTIIDLYFSQSLQFH